MKGKHFATTHEFKLESKNELMAIQKSHFGSASSIGKSTGISALCLKDKGYNIFFLFILISILILLNGKQTILTRRNLLLNSNEYFK